MYEITRDNGERSMYKSERYIEESMFKISWPMFQMRTDSERVSMYKSE